MKLDRKIIEKIRTGAALSNQELNDAFEFYTELEEALDILGSEFRLPWKEVMHAKERLRMFADARVNSARKKV